MMTVFKVSAYRSTMPHISTNTSLTNIILTPIRLVRPYPLNDERQGRKQQVSVFGVVLIST